LRTNAIKPYPDILIIALLVSAAGNCIVKVPAVVEKSPPKSNIHTAESVASPAVAAPPDD
jgi:hypothetical protein